MNQNELEKKLAIIMYYVLGYQLWSNIYQIHYPQMGYEVEKILKELTP